MKRIGISGPPEDELASCIRSASDEDVLGLQEAFQMILLRDPHMKARVLAVLSEAYELL